MVEAGARALMQKIVEIILDPIILILYAVAIAIFMWGLVQFIAHAGEDSDERNNGKRHMLWGIIGIFLMIAATAILRILLATFGIELKLP